MLSDGKEVKYRAWKTRIQGKLTANRDHFHDEQAMVAYVFARTEGEAGDHIEPWMETGEVKSVKELFQRMDEIYDGPHRRTIAVQEFRKLQLKPSDDFHEFSTKYRRLATDAKYPKDLWVEDMNQKLTFQLQEKAVNLDVEAMDFNTYVIEVGRIATRMKHLDEERKKYRSQKEQKNGGRTSPNRDAKDGKPTNKTNEKREGRAQRPLPHHADLKCYNCNEMGHIGKFCPKKKDVVQNVDENDVLPVEPENE